MTKYVYVPGMARTDADPADGSFKGTIEATFKDSYLTSAVRILIDQAAVAIPCSAALRWVCVPNVDNERLAARQAHHAGRPPARNPLLGPDTRMGVGAKPLERGAPFPGGADGTLYGGSSGKAFETLGLPTENLLSRRPTAAPGQIRVLPIDQTKPCSAPMYMAAPFSVPEPNAQGPLSCVGKGDLLYIVAHANPTGAGLSYKQKYTSPHGHCEATDHVSKHLIDDMVLAELLRAEGLRPKTGFDICLFACFSGGLPVHQMLQPFAQRLAGALQARNYRCRVYGALGLTNACDHLSIYSTLEERVDESGTPVFKVDVSDYSSHDGKVRKNPQFRKY